MTGYNNPQYPYEGDSYGNYPPQEHQYSSPYPPDPYAQFPVSQPGYPSVGADYSVPGAQQENYYSRDNYSSSQQAPLPSMAPEKKSTKKFLILGAIFAVVLLVAAGVGGYFFLYRPSHHHHSASSVSDSHRQSSSNKDESASQSQKHARQPFVPCEVPREVFTRAGVSNVRKTSDRGFHFIFKKNPKDASVSTSNACWYDWDGRSIGLVKFAHFDYDKFYRRAHYEAVTYSDKSLTDSTFHGIDASTIISSNGQGNIFEFIVVLRNGMVASLSTSSTKYYLLHGDLEVLHKILGAYL